LIDRDDQWIICEIDQAVKDLNKATGGSLIRSKLKRERDISIRQVTVFKP
jgi:hypothetical protein